MPVTKRLCLRPKYFTGTNHLESNFSTDLIRAHAYWSYACVTCNCHSRFMCINSFTKITHLKKRLKQASTWKWSRKCNLYRICSHSNSSRKLLPAEHIDLKRIAKNINTQTGRIWHLPRPLQLINKKFNLSLLTLTTVSTIQNSLKHIDCNEMKWKL